MNTTYINNKIVIIFDGRYFKNCERSRDAVTQAEWARTALSKPDVVFENGNRLHQKASQILNRAENTLINNELFFLQ